jgi:K+-sensing histidine kinase KdpD
VSHELRTPLAAIYGAAMTLRCDDVRLDETQRSGLLAVVANGADRPARTVNDILRASRFDVGTLSVAIESCDPTALASRSPTRGSASPTPTSGASSTSSTASTRS